MRHSCHKVPTSIYALVPLSALEREVHLGRGRGRAVPVSDHLLTAFGSCPNLALLLTASLLQQDLMRRRRWLQRHQWRRRCGCEVGGRDRHAAAALSHSSSRSRAERNEEGQGVLPDVYRPGAIPLGNWAYPGPKPPRTRASKGACWARGIPARKWASKLNRMEGGIPYIEQKGGVFWRSPKIFWYWR